MENFTDYLDAHRGALRGLQNKKEPPVSKEPPKKEPPKKEPPKKELTPMERLQEEEIKEKIRKYSGPSIMMKKGGKVGSASKRADGCAQRGKTRGRFV